MHSVFETQHFTIKQSEECFIPGYLIVIAKAKAPSIVDLPFEAQQALGPLLSITTQAIQTILHPERVYCMSFCELFHQLHFHLFPRTTWLAEKYRQAYLEEQNHCLNGPILFNWAKSTFTKPIPDHPLQPTLAEIRKKLVVG